MLQTSLQTQQTPELPVAHQPVSVLNTHAEAHAQHQKKKKKGELSGCEGLFKSKLEDVRSCHRTETDTLLITMGTRSL